MASLGTGTRADSRSVNVAVLGLRQAVAKARSSRTLQEGLYRAYTRHLCDLEVNDDVPQALREAIHELAMELRRAFGFDEVTGAKTAPSTLRSQHAARLLKRLGALATIAEALAVGAGTGLPH